MFLLFFMFVVLEVVFLFFFFFFSSRRRHTRWTGDWEFRRVLFRSGLQRPCYPKRKARNHPHPSRSTQKYQRWYFLLTALVHLTSVRWRKSPRRRGEGSRRPGTHSTLGRYRSEEAIHASACAQRRPAAPAAFCDRDDVVRGRAVACTSRAARATGHRPGRADRTGHQQGFEGRGEKEECLHDGEREGGEAAHRHDRQRL